MAVYHYHSPLGGMTLTGDGNAITGAWFNGQKYFGEAGAANRLAKRPPDEGEPLPEAVAAWLDCYFKGINPGEIPGVIFPEVSDFRRRVWALLCRIPYGKLVTYGDISREMERETGRRASAQAVGGAIGHNPISVIVPCHRVIGADGSLTGYAGGPEKKAALLRSEGIDLSLLAADPGRYRFSFECKTHTIYGDIAL